MKNYTIQTRENPDVYILAHEDGSESVCQNGARWSTGRIRVIPARGQLTKTFPNFEEEAEDILQTCAWTAEDDEETDVLIIDDENETGYLVILFRENTEKEEKEYAEAGYSEIVQELHADVIYRLEKTGDKEYKTKEIIWE